MNRHPTIDFGAPISARCRHRLLAIGVVLLSALTVLAQAASPARSAKGKQPNILFILADDMGCMDGSGLGSDFYETPNLDRLMSRGMRFTQAYANGPNCAPTRASLMSGYYSPRHGIYTVDSTARGDPARHRLRTPDNKTELAASFYTLAEALRDGGYATFHGGKWHLGSGPTGPLEQGFQVNVGGDKFGAPPAGTYFAPWPAPGTEDAPKGAHLCDYVTEKAIKFIEQPRTQPFFAYVAYYDVHTPLQAKPELLKKYESKLAREKAAGRNPQHNRPVYAAMLETLDTNVGRLMDALEASGAAGNTIVVFTSDNGGFGGATSMRPLRGAKGMLYEGGIRVPLAVFWPSHIAAGSECTVPVLTFDFYPTLLDAAGIDPKPAAPALDGVSLLPLLKGENARFSRSTLFWYFPAYLDKVPKGFESDAPEPGWRAIPANAIRQGEWKLIEYFEGKSVELFNLGEDPGERRNLASTYPEKAAALRVQLQQWRTSVGAPQLAPLPAPPK